MFEKKSLWKRVLSKNILDSGSHYYIIIWMNFI